MHSKFVKMVDFTHTQNQSDTRKLWEILDVYNLHYLDCSDGIVGVCLCLNLSKYTH